MIDETLSREEQDHGHRQEEEPNLEQLEWYDSIPSLSLGPQLMVDPWYLGFGLELPELKVVVLWPQALMLWVMGSIPIRRTPSVMRTASAKKGKENKIVNLLARFLPDERAREEWVGDFRERRQQWKKEGRSRWSIRSYTFGVGAQLIWAYIFCRIYDFILIKYREKP